MVGDNHNQQKAKLHPQIVFGGPKPLKPAKPEKKTTILAQDITKFVVAVHIGRSLGSGSTTSRSSIVGIGVLFKSCLDAEASEALLLHLGNMGTRTSIRSLGPDLLPHLLGLVIPPSPPEDTAPGVDKRAAKVGVFRAGDSSRLKRWKRASNWLEKKTNSNAQPAKKLAPGGWV